MNWTDELDPVLTVQEAQRLVWLEAKIAALEWMDSQHLIAGMTEAQAYRMAKGLCFARHLVVSRRISG